MAAKILVVEDDLDILHAVAELLTEEGYSVMYAGDGEQALEVLRHCIDLPALILLDLMMPRKDGAAFRKEQQSDPRLAAIPVILMSADRQIESKKVEMGLDHHIRKPLDLEAFLAIVQSGLSTNA